MGLTKFSVTCFIAAASLIIMSRGDYLKSSLGASGSSKFEEELREKCIKKGQESSYDNFVVVANKVATYLEGIRNIVKRMETIVDMEERKGELQDMLVKSCEQSETLKGLVREVVAAMKPCLEESEKESGKALEIIWNATLNFICYNHGNYLSSFIEKGGLACINEKGGTIAASLASVFEKYSKLSEQRGELPPFKLGEQECQDLFKIQMYVVKEMKTCPDPTPANIIESQFDEAFKDTPCGCFNPKPKKRGSGCTNAASSLHAFIHLFLLVLSIHLLRH